MQFHSTRTTRHGMKNGIQPRREPMTPWKPLCLPNVSHMCGCVCVRAKACSSRQKPAVAMNFVALAYRYEMLFSKTRAYNTKHTQRKSWNCHRALRLRQQVRQSQQTICRQRTFGRTGAGEICGKQRFQNAGPGLEMNLSNKACAKTPKCPPQSDRRKGGRPPFPRSSRRPKLCELASHGSGPPRRLSARSLAHSHERTFL